MFRRGCICVSVLVVLLAGCQGGSASVAAPTATLVPTFALPALTPIPSQTAEAIPTQESHAD